MPKKMTTVQRFADSLLGRSTIVTWALLGHSAVVEHRLSFAFVLRFCSVQRTFSDDQSPFKE